MFFNAINSFCKKSGVWDSIHPSPKGGARIAFPCRCKITKIPRRPDDEMSYTDDYNRSISCGRHLRRKFRRSEGEDCIDKGTPFPKK